MVIENKLLIIRWDLALQDEYENNDKLGTLACGHEYHVDCLKKWLLLKNVCPICKSAALAVEGKD